MADSPLNNAVDLPSFSILVDGTELNESILVLSIYTYKAVNEIGEASLTIRDGNPAKGEFPISENSKLKVGNEITIKFGYQQKEEVVFKGIITAQSLKVRSYEHRMISELIIKCSDKASKLNSIKKTENFKGKTDSDIITTLIANAGLSNDGVDSTSFVYENLVQYDVTDWEFILARAITNGLFIISNDGSLSVQKPEASGAEDLTLNYGVNVIDFKAEVSALNQLAKVEYNSWDASSQKYTTGKGTPIEGPSIGDFTPKDLADVVKGEGMVVNSSTPEDTTVLKSLSDSEFARSRFSKIRGEITSFGTPKAKVGGFIKLEGFGSRFNGVTPTSRVIHEFKEGKWTTTIGFGLNEEIFKKPKNQKLWTSGNMPSIAGLHIGKVKKIESDPLGEYRVQVDIPTIAETGDGLWARLSSAYATNEAGVFFYPEVSDEVVVGFLDSDPRFAVVLGSLHSKANTPPDTPDSKNNLKEIVTKSKLKISFEDEKKVLTIQTPGGQSVTLDDDGKSLTLEDENKNKIQLSSNGISINSSKDLNITAKGEMTFSATNKLSLSSKADLNLEGANVGAKAKIALKAEGAATTELKASGTMIIKGAMVQIN